MLTVCGSCGAMVAPERSTCFACNAPYSEARPLQRHPELHFALVTASELTCQHCQLKSPVSHLDLRSEIDCVRCGATQAFDNQQWVDGLEFAHVIAEVADDELRDPLVVRASFDDIEEIAKLMGTSGSGINRHNPALTTWTGKAPGEYQLRVSPGTPLCARCHAPLEVALDASGTLTTRCADCDERQSYALPATAAPLSGNLVGVIGEDHRADRTLARSASTAGSAAIALECPKCNASLPVERDQRLSTCGYCGTVSLIPPRFMRLADPKLAPFWLAFRGTSRWRRTVEEKRTKARRDEEKARDRATVSTPAEAGTRRAEVREQLAGRSAFPTVAVGAVVLALVAVVLYLLIR